MTGAVRRWGPWLLLVGVLAAALIIGVHRSSHLNLEQRTMSIAGKVRCPVCEGQSAAQAQTPASLAIRQEISRDLGKGESEQRILERLTASYGTAILESPPTSGLALWAWLLPVGATAAGGAGLILAFRHWRSGGARKALGELSAEDTDVVRAALDARSAGSGR